MYEEQVELGYVKYFKNAYIVMEGKQNANCFFIIQRGSVRVSREASVQGEKYEILGPGDFFGVISTMSSHNYIETAQALTDLILIKVYRHQYAGLIQKSAPIAIKIIMQFSQKLRHLNQTLAKLTLKDTAEDSPAHLFSVAEYYYKQKQSAQAFYAYTKYLKYCPGGDFVKTAVNRLAGLGRYAANVKTEFRDDESSRVYTKNSMIFAEGEPGKELFIIQKGTVKISKVVDDKEVLLAVLKAGDIFGEMALLEGKPRAANAIAYDDCHVIVITKANFEIMIKSQPMLIEKVTILLAERLWLVYKQLANTGIKNPLGRMYYALLIQLEKNRIPLNNHSPYTFNFGPDELFNMVGISNMMGRQFLNGMQKSKRIEILSDKIHTNSVMEIVKLAEYYRKMDLRTGTKKLRSSGAVL